MLKQKLADLKDNILLNNPYFDKGFTDVVQDDETGVINDNNQPIFPNDIFGNYFYLRIPQQAQFNYTPDSSMGDNNLGIRVDSKIFLIAMMKNAAADILIENLITTLGRYQPVNIRLIGATYQADTIIKQEMAGVKEKGNIQKALQTFQLDWTLVSIQFNISIPFVFQQLKCLTNPCKTC